MADFVLASLSSPALALDAPLVSGEPLHPVAERRQREAWADAAWPAREIRVIAVPEVIPPLLAVARSGATRPSPASWLE